MVVTSELEVLDLIRIIQGIDGCHYRTQDSSYLYCTLTAWADISAIQLNITSQPTRGLLPDSSMI